MYHLRDMKDLTSKAPLLLTISADIDPPGTAAGTPRCNRMALPTGLAIDAVTPEGYGPASVRAVLK
jgi:hypothetical protein